MTRYLLDTNTVSHLVRRHPGVSQRVTTMPMSALAVSAITEGELLFGLARRPEAVRLSAAVRELLLRVDVLPWDSRVAEVYGALRSHMAGSGRSLAPLDMLIAAHARAVDAVLVTNDRAFRQVPNLAIEDWVK
ncbi:type II toxin-antitoxin system VapC family toxin [Nitrospirillum viridazoti]|uniref:Ribonuclease VapC n=1 Tax=Nitrospirillum viridazoti CBAmc TaxID=1441467 RepID=A0A248JW23_9PROT|nr:type II toxin-antitoxin system VapC family toxin [Nitrospirillum amazonense]ASG22923.1 VapC toxin family PIN domain ribonuclease [Nitrospirillum amazonense CBAmc]TWB31464.1 tRNA(fMet)-specific endonuclease VapC [Nitrospirillum amazonense]